MGKEGDERKGEDVDVIGDIITAGTVSAKRNWTRGNQL